MGRQNSNIYPGLTFRMVIVSSELFQVDPTQSFNEEPTMFSYVLRKHADLSSL